MFFRLKIFLEDYIVRYNLRVQSIGGKQGFKKYYWKYTTVKNWFGSGKGEVLMVIDFFRDLAIGNIALKLLVGQISTINLILINLLISVFLIFVYLLVGHFKDFTQAWNIEQEWANLRNPTLKRIEKAVKKRG